MHNGATLCLTAVSVHGPLLGGGRNQHRPSHGAGLPQWRPERADRRRQARRLTLQNRVRIQGVIRRSVLEADLIETDFELFGEQHRHGGVDALPHFDHRHHERHHALSIDADEGIRRKRRRRRLGERRALAQRNREVDDQAAGERRARLDETAPIESN